MTSLPTNPSRPALTNLQVELLKVFSRPVADDDLIAIRQLISAFFAQKAVALANAAWDEQGFSETTMDTWRHGHFRTPYPATTESMPKPEAP